jgi:hypothetical protein
MRLHHPTDGPENAMERLAPVLAPVRRQQHQPAAGGPFQHRMRIIPTHRGFQRVNVKAGQTATATIKLNKQTFEFWDAETNTMRVKPGKYEILVGSSSDEKNKRELMIMI